MRVLLFSTLYPSSARPRHGAFVETRLLHLLAFGGVEARVVAPVPWFPFTNERFGAWAPLARTPRREVRAGVTVDHPRYLLPPKIGQTIAPAVLAAGALPALRRLRREGFDFDLIDAHYLYPDGVAAVMLGRWLGKPVALTARGSDINVLGSMALPQRMMRWALGHAAASSAVSRPLLDTLLAWGADPTRSQLLRNGVDLVRFAPIDQGEARRRLGLDGAPLLLCVGNLVPIKGHALALDTLAELRSRHPQARLVLVGEGPARAGLAQRAAELGLADRVAWAGAVAPAELAAWYSAADLLLLPSVNEGWANVLLESMACGTAVVATDVGAARDMIVSPLCGALVRSREPAAMAAAVEACLSSPPDRAALRRHAEGFGWDETSRAQLDLFHRIADVHAEGLRRVEATQP